MSTETKPAPASLGFGDAFEDIDISAWTPAAPKNDPKPDKKAVKKVAEKAGYTSREPIIEPQPEPQEQINIKANKTSIDAFRALYKNQTPKWPQGYAFERAVAALERELAGEG